MLETNMSEVLTHIEAQSKLEKSETTASSIMKVGRHKDRHSQLTDRSGDQLTDKQTHSS